jgi:membrane protein implicated in regulation of membrane protease activity
MKHASSTTIALVAALCATAALWVQPAAAYVGPGAGLSLLGALWGLVVAVAAAVGFVIAWPVRRLLRGRSASRGQETTAREPQP